MYWMFWLVNTQTKDIELCLNDLRVIYLCMNLLGTMELPNRFCECEY